MHDPGGPVTGQAGHGPAAGGPDPRPGRDGRFEPWLTPGRLASLAAVLIAAYLTFVMVAALRGVLVMLLVALFLSFAMEPAVQFLARRGWRRGLATAAVFLAVAIGTVGTVAAMVPLIVDQVTGLVRSIPQSISELNQLMARLPFNVDLEASPELRRQVLEWSNELGDRAGEVALGAAGNVVNIGATAAGVLVRALAVGFITFYLVADGPRLRQTLARPLPPARQREMLAIWELAVAKTGGYIYSRLFIGFASAAAHTVFLLLVGVPFALPLGLWMGAMTAFVPLVGVYLGGILLLVVAAVHEPVQALWVLIFLTIYQQVENYVLAPKVQAHTMDLHPAVAFVSVLVGATLLGAVGALLALPAAAITKALLSTYVRRHELISELAEVPLPVIPGEEASPTGPAPAPGEEADGQATAAAGRVGEPGHGSDRDPVSP
ncbi:MAG TPA: AI-2E family transporter [Egibacteraceae bacterium]|nr:AI-2E family transporter [Egibacteraceae bacterium]